MNQQELQEKIDQFVATLGEEEEWDWCDTDKEVGSTVLNSFLWWMFPELEPQDLQNYDRWPWYTKEPQAQLEKIIITGGK